VRGERLAATPLAERTGPLVEKGETPHPAGLSRWLRQHPPPASALSRLASEITLAAPAPRQP